MLSILLVVVCSSLIVFFFQAEDGIRYLVRSRGLGDVYKRQKHDNATLFIDASAEFVRSGNKNKLTEAHQQKILDAYIARQDAAHFARLVENAAIAENGYNIAVSSYVAQEDTHEVVNIQALNAEIARIVARQAELRTAIDAIVADLEGEAE